MAAPWTGAAVGRVRNLINAPAVWSEVVTPRQPIRFQVRRGGPQRMERAMARASSRPTSASSRRLRSPCCQISVLPARRNVSS
jgi:hypothetical protein